MAITYTWKIDLMHTQSKLGLQNAVTEIHWSKTGTDENGTIGRYAGCTKFKIEDIVALNTAGNFTSLNSLTESKVLGWIKDTITLDDMNFIDAQIQSAINNKNTPAVGSSIKPEDMPWAK
jgi:hypothetical protein